MVRTRWIARGLDQSARLKLLHLRLWIPSRALSTLGHDFLRSFNVCGCLTRLSQMEQVPTAREARDRYLLCFSGSRHGLTRAISPVLRDPLSKHEEHQCNLKSDLL